MSTTSIRPDQPGNGSTSSGRPPSGRSARGTGGSGPGWGGASPSSQVSAGAMPWLLALAISAAVLGSALGINGAVLGWQWLVKGSLTVLAVMLVMAAVRAFRAPAVLVPLAGLATLVLLLTFEFFAGTAILGIIPTRATFEALGPLVRLTNNTIVGGIAPVPLNPGIGLLICAGLGLVALLMDALAIGLSMPATSGVGILAVMLVPALVKVDSVGPWGFLGGAIGFLLLLGLSEWHHPDGRDHTAAGRQPGQFLRGSAIGTCTIVLTLVVAAVVPGFDTGTFPQGSRLNPFGASTGLNPLISLGNDLRSPSGSGIMRYSTDAKGPLYLRSTSISDFSGGTWSPDDADSGLRPDPARITDSSSTAAVINGVFTTTRIDAQNVNSPWLPAPYAPLSVSGLKGSWGWDPQTLSIKSQDTSTLHQTYLVHSVMPQLSKTLLAGAISSPGNRVDQKFLALPSDIPDIVRKTEQQVVGQAPSPYDKAMAIQNYLRGSQFTYSEQTPLKDGYDGSSMNVVAKFLEVKAGYCVHFAATMAVMAREAGIPSRIAVGFAPGRPTGNIVSVNGLQLTEFSVDGHNAHAWPELYFEGLGWVPFEPTPGRGQVPDYAQQDAAAVVDPANPRDGLLPGGGPATTSQPSTAPAAAPLPGDPGSVAAGDAVERLWLFAGVLVLLVLLATPALARTGLRRRRELALAAVPAGRPGGEGGAGGGAGDGRAGGGAGDGGASPVGFDAGVPARTAWAELRDTAYDYGIPAQISDTPRTFAARLRGALGRAEDGGQDGVNVLKDSGSPAGADGSPTGVDRLAAAYERSAYGRPSAVPPAGLGTDLQRARAGLKRQASPWRRVRVAVLPPSTFARWGRWWADRMETPLRTARRANPARMLLRGWRTLWQRVRGN